MVPWRGVVLNVDSKKGDKRCHMLVLKLSETYLKKEMISFVEGMFNSWVNESSVSHDLECCPQRTFDEIYGKLESSNGVESEILLLMKYELIAGIFFIEFRERSVHGSLLNVHPDFRRQRGAFLLLSAAMCELANKGLERMTLETWEGNDRAITLFRKFGFVPRTRELESKRVDFVSYLPKVLSSVHQPKKSRCLNYEIFNNDKFSVNAKENNEVVEIDYKNIDEFYSGLILRY